MKITSSIISLFLLQQQAGVQGFIVNQRSSGPSATQLHADKYKVFIDGEAGTTGLQVRQRIEKRDDLEIISAPDELRKDEDTRKKLINEADAVILCKLICALGYVLVAEFNL